MRLWHALAAHRPDFARGRASCFHVNELPVVIRDFARECKEKKAAGCSRSRGEQPAAAPQPSRGAHHERGGASVCGTRTAQAVGARWDGAASDSDGDRPEERVVVVIVPASSVAVPGGGVRRDVRAVGRRTA